jgi:hypothetical protein
MPSLVVDIQAKFAQFQESLKRIEGQTTQAASRMESAFNSVRAAIGALGVGASLAGFGSFVKSTIDLADELGKLSQRTGIAVESLSALRNAAELSDVSTEEFVGGIRRLNLALTEAQDGTSKIAQVFRALGVDATSDAETALRGIADAFSRLPDGAQKAALANEIFGRSGEKLIPLLNGGAKSFDEARQSAERFGTLISTQLSKDSETFNDNLTKLKQSASGLGVALADPLVRNLLRVSDALIILRGGGEAASKVLNDATLSAGRLLAQLGAFRGGGPAFDAIANIAGGAFNRTPQQPGNVATGQIGRPEPAAPSQAAIALALNPLKPTNSATARAGRASVGKSEPTFDDLLALAAAKRREDQERIEAEGELAANKELAEFKEILLRGDIERERIGIALSEQAERERAAQIASAEAIKDKLDPTRQYFRELEKVAALEEAGLLTQSQAIAETNRLAQAFKDAGRAAEDSGRFARDLGLVFVSSFEQAIAGGKGLRGILKGLESDLLKLGTRALVTNPFLEFLSPTTGPSAGKGIDFAGLAGRAGSAISSFFGFANGGAFAPGGVQAFAGGGIVSRPTLFPFASGGALRTGLMGEAGPEAIMPLQRGRDGKLGVAGSGGATVVFNVSTPDANSFRASQGQMMADAQRQLSRAGRRNG